MRNNFGNTPELLRYTALLPLFIFLFFVNLLSAQRVKVYPGPNDSTTIETYLTINDPIPANNDPYPMDTQNGETSFGYFYRIDSAPENSTDNIQKNEGAYYWKDDLPNGVLSIKKTIALPPGKYALIVYESRKSKPIRTLLQDKTNPVIFEVPSPVSPNVNFFQAADMTVNNVPSSIKLENSWNVFTDTKSVLDPVDHNTFSSASIQPAQQPWFFITLSLQQWQQQVTLNYDDKIFTYGGAIFRNKKDDFSAGAWASSIVSNTGQLSIKRGALPVNASDQTHIHLIFQLKPDAQFFSEYVQFSAQLETGHPFVLSLPVKPKPHDPNNLKVDKKTICPCANAIDLNYRVEFQNIGTGPVKDVRVVLMDTQGWDVSSLVTKGGNTLKKGAPMLFHMGPRAAPAPTFEIEGINLPGTNQAPPKSVPDDETWDYFEFTVKTKDCLKDNTFIRPKARVYFADVSGYLDTNIGETHVLYSAGQSTDAAPMSCSKIISLNCQNCLSKPVDTKIKKNRD